MIRAGITDRHRLLTSRVLLFKDAASGAWDTIVGIATGYGLDD
jgi:hypothetical protein